MRGITISRLRQIADYMESVCRRTGIARVVGSGGGILAGSLTVAGGVLTVLTAGAAAPVLVGKQYRYSRCCGSGSVGSLCFWTSRIRIH